MALTLTLGEALQHIARAARGSLSDLGIILRSIVSGQAGEEIQFLDGVTAGTGKVSKALVLDSSGNLSGIPGEVELDGNVSATAGIGITGTADAFETSVIKIGGIITTKILIDLDSLNSGAHVNDIIGADGAGKAHLGQILAAKNGTILAGTMECLEAPTGGEPDIDLHCATADTGVEDTLVTDLTNDELLNAGTDWTLGLKKVLTAMPPTTEYLYLSGSQATDAAYSAGIFLITLYGYDA